MEGNQSWKHNLIRDMNQTSNHMFRNDLAVCIRDKYPKSRHHFLVLPWAQIDNVYELTRRNIPLLTEMHLLGMKAVESIGGSPEDFRFGFHMKPSLYRLHLHVISSDFVSHGLKHKKHWNCFHTELFMPFQDILAELKKRGRIERRPECLITQLLATPLACHRCDRKFDTMAPLKEHLRDHLGESTSET